MTAFLGNLLTQGVRPLDEIMLMITGTDVPVEISRANVATQNAGDGGRGNGNRHWQQGGESDKSDLGVVKAYLRSVAYLRLPRSMAAQMVEKGEALLIATEKSDADFIRSVATHLRDRIPLKTSRQGESMKTLIDSLLTDYEVAREFPAVLPERFQAADPESELPMRSLDLAEIRFVIARVVESLDERERAILRSRFWDGLSCRDTGRLYDLGKSRVSEIVQEILMKIAVAIARYRSTSPHRNV